MVRHCPGHARRPPSAQGDWRRRVQDGTLKERLVGECLRQEASTSSWIDMPEEIRELYIHAGKPRPLYRARRLENRLGLKRVRIYYKQEDLSPTGSHKVNIAIAQAFYAVRDGKETLVTETGAGQRGKRRGEVHPGQHRRSRFPGHRSLQDQAGPAVALRIESSRLRAQTANAEGRYSLDFLVSIVCHGASRPDGKET